MKLNRLKIIIITPILMVLIVCICFLGFNRKNAKNINKYDFSSLRDGDVIFRRGRSIESFGVCVASNDMSFSHVGIVHKSANELCVIHIVPEEKDVSSIVKNEPLKSFLDPGQSSCFGIYRTNYNENQIANMLERTKDFFNNQCHFDNKYDLESDNLLYCSELVVKAFASIDSSWFTIPTRTINLGVVNKDIIMPVDIIKYQNLKPLNF